MGRYTVGIDLGTTNTLCCTFDNSFEFVKIKRGYLLPSVMMYKDGKITIGDMAKQRSLRLPENIIASSKTFIGNFTKTWTIEDRHFDATDVAAEILTEVRLAAQKHFNTDGEIEAVITVPAYFSASQYDETKKAAERAGFKVINIISEPVAAAIACGFEDNVHSVFVIDIGGGTFDICLLNVENNGTKFETKCVDGDNQLGGDDFDQVIVQMCYSQLRKEYGIDLSSVDKSGLDTDSFRQALQKIAQKAEQAKIALSDADETDIEIANLCTKDGVPINFRFSVQRKAFETAAMPLFNKIKRIILRCLEDSNVDPKSIEKIIFVGGSANIPHIKHIINDCFGQEAFADKDLSKLVSMGAALCAAQKNNLVSTKLIIEDILSHSLGIRVVNDRLSIILPKGIKYPTKKVEKYTTVSDYQSDVLIEVYEGENIDDINKDTKYGQFVLSGIQSALKGVPEILVTFEITQDRQLLVTAKDKQTGVTKTITIDKR